MRRRYDTAAFRRAVELIRENVPNVSITTDVIVGFPGEAPRNHAASLAFAAEMGFADIHVFPYSQRPGTTAHHLPDQVDAAEKRRRAAEMSTVAEEGFIEYRNRLAGQTRPVLWETARSITPRHSRDDSRHSRERTSPRTPIRGGNPGATLRWSGLTDNYVRVVTETGLNLANRITPARLLRPDGKAMLATTSD